MLRKLLVLASVVYIAIFTLCVYSACTLKVDVPPPDITVQCVVIELPNGGTSTLCPDGGDGGSESG